jgi:hypothetical protein
MKKLMSLMMFLTVFFFPFVAHAAFSGDYEPDIAYDNINHQYLVVFQKISSGPIDIFGQFIDSDGMEIGPAFKISRTSFQTEWPAVAFDTVNQRFLVVWQDSDAGSDDIYGQIVNADGSLNGNRISISNVAGSDQVVPSIAFDNVNQRYLVAWSDGRNAGAFSDYGIFGQLIDSTGNKTGNNFSISEAPQFSQRQTAIAFDSVNRRFMIVWSKESTVAFNSGIFAILLDPNGSTFKTDFEISSMGIGGPGGPQKLYPSVAFDPDSKRFLVVWWDIRSTDDIYGQAVKSNGTLVDHDGDTIPDSTNDNFNISKDTANTPRNPDIVYEPVNKRFMVVWRTGNPGGAPDDIYGRGVGADGTLVSARIPIETGNMSSLLPAIAYNSYCGNSLVVYELNDGAIFTIEYSVLGICDPIKTGGDGSGGGCFIATAAYGSYMHDDVMVLREFRDKYLLTNAPGEAFVNAYYKYSPPIADYISEHGSLRVASRIALTPIVYSIKYPFASGFVVIISGVLMVRRRKKSRKK